MKVMLMAESNMINLKGDIGLTLSGGGYRAAAFHLGVIDYLEHLKMLDQVKMLSTVSGGTFTGAKLALAQAEKQGYADFFDGYYNLLAKTDLLALGLDQLAYGGNFAPSKRKDMIVSMAQVYANTFFKKANGEPYLFGEILNAKNMNLREISFNATEFKYGLAFRFQRSNNPKALIGNQRIHIPKKQAESIRIADIVTASSCFPGGFEPFAFPDDFVWPGGKIPQPLQEQFEKGALPLMDGGIYDNQGLQSLLLADVRVADGLQLFIISDAGQKSDNLFPYPTTDNKQGGLTLDALAKLSVVFIVLFIITLVKLLHKLFTEETGFLDFFFLGLVPVTLTATAAYSLFWVRNKANKIMDKIPLVGRTAWKDIRNLTVDEVLNMVGLRISSLFALAGSIFMKRIRSLVYGLIYGDIRGPVDKAINELYEGKRISNLIYHLQEGELFSQDLKKAGVPETSKTLSAVTTRAAKMPTTLWFDNEQQLQDLVATGQATLCYNLMKHLVRCFGQKPGQFPEDIKPLWDKLIADWLKFNEEAVRINFKG
jgi:predicted acylesterase/phospholipase RssA